MTYEPSRSTNTPGQPSYSPASQRSRYSQPNLPTLMIPYNEQRSSVSSDRRIRMSQPTLNSSFSGINFMGYKGSRLSYSSLRTSGDTSIHLPIHGERLSTPNVHSYVNIQDNDRRASVDYRRGSRLSQPDVRRILRPNEHKRERLSQPTLVTGDYYPPRMQHQRLSQPCLLSTWNEKPITLRSPIKQKYFGPAVKKITQRERMSQLDFGSSRFRYNKDLLPAPTNKFNRDRFSIPELETQNDLRAMAGTPKQRFSLDSQLNPESKARRLLPIASSPISELTGKEGSFLASEGLENIIVATATPLIPSGERQILGPILKSAPPTLPIPARERMSVPEIRNSSLRRLLDPPLKQRHSISGSLRQSLVYSGKSMELMANKSPEDLEGGNKKCGKIELERTDEQDEIEIKIEPKHIQRHYSYTYDTKDETNEVIGKLSVALPKKKYLESNFDGNEQVITTVIETEIPMILSSPKYMKKTHVYATETPKWMIKCLESPGKQQEQEILKINQLNKSKISPEKSTKKVTSPSKIRNAKVNEIPEASGNRLTVSKIMGKPENKGKNTSVRMKTTGNHGENKYEVSINSDWSEADICRLYGLDCDTDSEDSTSV